MKCVLKLHAAPTTSLRNSKRLDYVDTPKEFMWKEVNAQAILSSEYKNINVAPPCTVRRTAVAASSMLEKPSPVYVSIATIRSRVANISLIVCDLLSGHVLPDSIFIFTSPTPFLLDSGIKLSDIPQSLLVLASTIHSANDLLSTRFSPANITTSVNIIQTDGLLGPHRKLLPLLYRVRKSDAVIITMDDDIRVVPSYVEQFMESYRHCEARCIVAGTVRRVGVRISSTSSLSTDTSATLHPLPYRLWAKVQECDMETLVLPVGRGSVLYHPRFFHPVVFDTALRKLTYSNDDLTFRLATLVNRIPVSVVAADKPMRTDLDPLQYSRYNGTSLFRQRNRASNNYSNVAQWQAGIRYLEAIGLLDYADLFRSLLLKEREWFCQTNVISSIVYFKQCALKFKYISLNGQVTCLYFAIIILILWFFGQKLRYLAKRHAAVALSYSESC